MLDGPALSDERVRALADELLARSRYAAYRGPKTTLQEWVEALADWLRDIGHWIPSWVGDLWAWVKGVLLQFRIALDGNFLIDIGK